MSRLIFKDDSHTADYDGIGTTVFPSAEAAEAYISDPEQEKILKEDPKIYAQESTFRVVAGDEVVFLNQTANK